MASPGSAVHDPGAAQGRRAVEPWTVYKSKRGRPKAVETDGQRCPNPACPYYQITDSGVHALVGDGLHHGADSIQYLRCQACHTKFSARRVEEVVTATSEGVDVAAASRIFKHDERTIQRWLTRMATHSQRLHHRFFHDLVCQHLQLTQRQGLVAHDLKPTFEFKLEDILRTHREEAFHPRLCSCAHCVGHKPPGLVDDRCGKTHPS